jgi:hypothetical protein
MLVYAVLYHDVRGHRELREVCASPEGAEKYIINAHADASVVQIEWDSGHTYAQCVLATLDRGVVLRCFFTRSRHTK